MNWTDSLVPCDDDRDDDAIDLNDVLPRYHDDDAAVDDEHYHQHRDDRHADDADDAAAVDAVEGFDDVDDAPRPDDDHDRPIEMRPPMRQPNMQHSKLQMTNVTIDHHRHRIKMRMVRPL